MPKGYPTIDTFLGKPVSHWYEVMRAMAAQGIDSGAELEFRLGSKAKSLSVNVYDKLNEKRLLGSLINPPPLLHAAPMFLEVAVMRPTTCAPFDPNHDIFNDIYRVRFEVRFNDRSADGYERRATFHTDAALDRLMLVDNFRLPGESDRDAHKRRFNRY